MSTDSTPSAPATLIEVHALRRVEAQARDALKLAAAMGLHLGPLRAALDDVADVRARIAQQDPWT